MMKGYEDSLINKSGELLKDLSMVEEFTSDSSYSLTEQESEKLRSEELRVMNESLGLSVDGYVEYRIAEDRMSCFADFHPPTPDGKPIAVDEVQRELHEKGIVFGIDWESTGSALFECNTENREILDVPVARGRQPVVEIMEHYVLHDKFLQDAIKKHEVERGKKIDFRERNPFILVKQGDVLAIRREGVSGKPGIDIFGKELPKIIQKMPTLSGKGNTEKTGETIIAVCDGLLRIQDNSVQVDKILHVEGNINYKTGNIDFPGTVYIDGYVEDGFKIRAGESIFCKKTLNATDVTCKLDLEVRGGIIGRGAAKVVSGGKVNVKFIENCYLEATKDVYSEVGSINSVIQTLGSFQTSPRGIIVGGKIFAQNGVETVNIGTPSSPKTEIICGTNFMVNRKLEWIRDKNIEFALHLGRVRKTIEHTREPGRDLTTLRDQLLSGIKKLNEAAQVLVPQLTKSEEAKVIATGTVAAGTYIEICNVSHVVQRRLKCVVFSLDKEKGKIDVSPYFMKN